MRKRNKRSSILHHHGMSKKLRWGRPSRVSRHPLKLVLVHSNYSAPIHHWSAAAAVALKLSIVTRAKATSSSKFLFLPQKQGHFWTSLAACCEFRSTSLLTPFFSSSKTPWCESMHHWSLQKIALKFLTSWKLGNLHSGWMMKKKKGRKQV